MKRLSALIICIILLLTGCASRIQAKELVVANVPTSDQWHDAYSALTDPRGNAEYVKKLVSSLIEDDGENKVVSPANIYFALAMLAECTDGDTQKQILDLLGRSDIEKLRENAYILWQKMYSDNDEKKSVLSNSLWISDNHADSFKKDTLKLLQQKHFASAYNGDFGDGAFVKQLRDWINEQTGGLLKDSAQKLEISPETVMALVSTLYYKAQWSDEFIKENTKKEIFHAPDGDLSVPFMKESCSGTLYHTDKFSAVKKELVYGVEKMTFILPNDGYTVSDILKDENTLDFIAENNRVGVKDATINLSVPKFDISFDTSLKDSLQKLGVKDVFDPKRADFSPLTDGGIFVERAGHAARLKIDEEGVEGAAYTAMTLEDCIMDYPDEIDFVLDKPFVVVVSGKDNLPLFVGIVNNP